MCSPPFLSVPVSYFTPSVFQEGTQKDVKQENIANEVKNKQTKKQPFNYEEERINISAVKLLSVSAIKKCFCIIGDFLHPSERGVKVNSESLHLSVWTN